MLYKFSAVYVTPLNHPVLCANLEKAMSLVSYHNKDFCHSNQSKIALYSVDCVKRLLLNHYFNDEFISERLDEARAAEMKNDQEFWGIAQHV